MVEGWRGRWPADPFLARTPREFATVIGIALLHDPRDVDQWTAEALVPAIDQLLTRLPLTIRAIAPVEIPKSSAVIERYRVMEACRSESAGIACRLSMLYDERTATLRIGYIP